MGDVCDFCRLIHSLWLLVAFHHPSDKHAADRKPVTGACQDKPFNMGKQACLARAESIHREARAMGKLPHQLVQALKMPWHLSCGSCSSQTSYAHYVLELELSLTCRPGRYQLQTLRCDLMVRQSETHCTHVEARVPCSATNPSLMVVRSQVSLWPPEPNHLVLFMHCRTRVNYLRTCLPTPRALELALMAATDTSSQASAQARQRCLK